jgi:arsenate reductase (glutaredoxin)
MHFEIIHNPRCSKSRQALSILQENGIEPSIREYLKKPLTREELEKILGMLNTRPINICRRGESLFRELGLSVDDPDHKVFEMMLSNPKLIERPIVIKNQKSAVLARPPENVKILLDL